MFILLGPSTKSNQNDQSLRNSAVLGWPREMTDNRFCAIATFPTGIVNHDFGILSRNYTFPPSSRRIDKRGKIRLKHLWFSAEAEIRRPDFAYVSRIFGTSGHKFMWRGIRLLERQKKSIPILSADIEQLLSLVSRLVFPSITQVRLPRGSFHFNRIILLKCTNVCTF